MSNEMASVRPRFAARWLVGDDPGRGAGLDDEDRPLAGALEGQDAAAALHHQELGFDPRPRSRSSIEPRYSWTIGWIPALMTTVLARSYSRNSGTMLRRQRDGDVGQLVGEDLPDPLARGPGWRRRAAGRRRPTRRLAPATCARPIEQLPRRAAAGLSPRKSSRSGTPKHSGRGTSGTGFWNCDVVQRRADLAADLEHVAEALGRDQGGPGDAALDDRVRGDGRAVDDVAERRRGPRRPRRGSGPWPRGSPRSGRSAWSGPC